MMILCKYFLISERWEWGIYVNMLVAWLTQFQPWLPQGSKETMVVDDDFHGLKVFTRQLSYQRPQISCQQSKFQLQQSFSCGFKIGLISSQHVCGDSMIGPIHFNSLPDLSADWNPHKHDHRGNKIPKFYHFAQWHSVIPILQEICFLVDCPTQRICT